MQDATQIVAALDDVQVIAMAKRINADIVAAVPRDQLVAVPEAARQAAILEGLNARTTLDPARAVEASRRLLAALAADPGTAPLVTRAWAVIEEDDSLMIETIIALGLIANLTLFMATSRLKLNIGSLEVVKETATPELVKAVIDPVVELIRRVPA